MMRARLITSGRIAGIAALSTAWLCSPVRAATWDGSTGIWSDATKWGGNVPDTSAEDATIPGGAVTLDSAYSIRDFTLSGGQILGAPGFSLTVNRAFLWNGGAIGSGANLFSGSSGSLQIVGAVQNSGTLNIANNAVSASGGAVLNNFGATNWFAGAGTTPLAAVFNNSGTLAVNSGTLSLTAGGSSTAGSTFNIASTGRLVFTTGTFVFAAGTSIGNDGSIINQSAISISASDFVGKHLEHAGNELRIEGNLDSDGGAGGFKWTRGVISGAGTTINTASIEFNALWGVGGGRTLQNDSTINYTGGLFGFGDSAVGAAGDGTIHNSTSGVLNVSQVGDFANAGASTLHLVNDGSLVFSAGAGSVSLPQVIDHAASAAMRMASGQVNLGGGGSVAGSVAIDSGATLAFTSGATHTIAPTATFTGGGTLRFDTENTVAFPATVAMNSASTFDAGSSASSVLALQNGASISAGTFLVGESTVRVGTGASVNVSHFAQSGGRLDLQGGHVTASSDFTSSGFITGSGTISANAPALSALIEPGIPETGETGTIDLDPGAGGSVGFGPSVLIVKVNGSSANDRVDVAGTAAFDSSFLAVTVSGSPSGAATYTIFQFANRDGQPSYTNDPDRESPTQNFIVAMNSLMDETVGSFRIQFNDTSIVLSDFQPVPEPAALAGMGFTLLLLKRRRSGSRDV